MKRRVSKATHKKIAAHLKRLHADPAFRAANRERMQRLNANPEFAVRRDARARATIQRLNADPTFQAAASERMKRRRADPAFNAAHRAAMQRLWADPKFKAAHRARMKRRNATTRDAIIAALKADPSAKRVASSVGGVSYATIIKIAKAERIKLRKLTLTPHQQREATQRRDSGERLGDIARSYNVHPSTICRLAA